MTNNEAPFRQDARKNGKSSRQQPEARKQETTTGTSQPAEQAEELEIEVGLKAETREPALPWFLTNERPRSSTGQRPPERFPLDPPGSIEWDTIHRLPPSFPQVAEKVSWAELLPAELDFLAEILEERTGSRHPFWHQVTAIRAILAGEPTAEGQRKGLITNGGTQSGKTISFLVPGLVQLLQAKARGEADRGFMVLFYPTKQLLQDQFARLQEWLLAIEQKTGCRLTAKRYSGDLGRTDSDPAARGAEVRELRETEEEPPDILVATFDKVWYQLLTGKELELLERLKRCLYLVFDEIHAFSGLAAAAIRGFLRVHRQRNPGAQVVLASATIDAVSAFRDAFLPDGTLVHCPPVRGEVTYLGTTVESTVPVLAGLWQTLERLPGKFVLVFLDSKADLELLAERLTRKLQQEQPEEFDPESIAVLHADLPYRHRQQVLEGAQAAASPFRVLLTTSALELGVHLRNVQTVINIGWPITHKDGITQRFGRNRSSPGERRTNIQIFDEEWFRDKFYRHHPALFRALLEAGACRPVLYPQQNPQVLAALLLLQVHYGVTATQELLAFFDPDGAVVRAYARREYSRLLALGVLRKGEKGTVRLVPTRLEAVLAQHPTGSPVVPLSLRAIRQHWTIELYKGNTGGALSRSSRPVLLGKLTVREVLRKGLPGNVLLRNKRRYLVVGFDRQRRRVLVKRLPAKTAKGTNKPGNSPSFFSFGYPLNNQLSEPEVQLGLFPTVLPGAEHFQLAFGTVTITHRPLAIFQADPDHAPCRAIVGGGRGKASKGPWHYLSTAEREDYALSEQSEGLVLQLQPSSALISDPRPKGLTDKRLLQALGQVLRVELEASLAIPTSEVSLAVNSEQLVLYDCGGANGNLAYSLQQYPVVIQQALRRLQSCPCARGCEHCYSDLLDRLPKGSKNIMIAWLQDLLGVAFASPRELSVQPTAARGENRSPKEVFPSGSSVTDGADRRERTGIVALSDVHLDAQYCDRQAFYQALRQLAPTAELMIINGDLCDTTTSAGRQHLREFWAFAVQQGFWNRLVVVRSSSVHDGLLSELPGLLLLDYAAPSIKNSETVLFVHGNKLGLDPALVDSVGAEVAAIQAKQALVREGRSWLPPLSPTTHLVLGHLHRRFYNERFRVYGLGHWTTRGQPYHQRCLLLLRPASPHEPLSLFSDPTSVQQLLQTLRKSKAAKEPR